MRRKVAVRGRDDPNLDVHRAALRRRGRPRRPARRAAAGPGPPSGSSPTSSRNSVPPSACSNQPLRRVTAPVNAPCSWPNSSESISSGAIAPQFTRRNGPLAKRRVLVNRARDDLLAGPRFAEQQHRRAAARDHPRARHDRRQPRVAANQPLFADAGDRRRCRCSAEMRGGDRRLRFCDMFKIYLLIVTEIPSYLIDIENTSRSWLAFKRLTLRSPDCTDDSTMSLCSCCRRARRTARVGARVASRRPAGESR